MCDVRAKTFQLRREQDHLGAARSVRLVIRMDDVKVRQSATYGASVWGTRFNMVEPDSKIVNNPLEQQHLHFLRSWCHLRGSEPKWLIYRALGRLPLHYYWWRDVIRFSNRIHRSPQVICGVR